jgi:3-oxoadipate enol-lactonase
LPAFATSRSAARSAAGGPRLLKIWGTGADLRRPPTGFDRYLATRFTVVAFDQRGMGRSGKPERDCTMADYADDAAGLLDAVGWERAAVLGYSFGGMVAQELALRHPGRVARLALVSTSAGGAGGSSYPLHEWAELDDEARVRRLLELADSRRTPQWQLANPALWQSLVDAGMAALQLGCRTIPRSASAGCGNWRHGGSTIPGRLASRIAGAGYHEYAGGHPFFVEDRGAAAMIADTLGGDVPFTPGS